MRKLDFPIWDERFELTPSGRHAPEAACCISRIRCCGLVNDRDGWGSLGRRQCSRDATVIFTEIRATGNVSKACCRQHARAESRYCQVANIRHTFTYRPNPHWDRAATAAWDARAQELSA